jgi:hypothetical protein
MILQHYTLGPEKTKNFYVVAKGSIKASKLSSNSLGLHVEESCASATKRK